MATPFIPVLSFHYQVEWGGTRIGFTEVSGLTTEVQSIDYREGIDPEYMVTKIPGLHKQTDLTLSRGMAPHDNEFFQWLTTVKLNQVDRRDLTISLLDENHAPIVTWNVKSAWPMKVEGPSLKATGNEVSVEKIVLANQGLTITFN